jgi:hypothetical protein
MRDDGYARPVRRLLAGVGLFALTVSVLVGAPARSERDPGQGSARVAIGTGGPCPDQVCGENHNHVLLD